MNKIIRKQSCLYLLLLLSFYACSNHSNEKTNSEKITINSIYSWLCSMQNENGLILSSENGKYISLYDNALAAITFTRFGDYNRAEKIFDFFNARLDSELNQFPGGFGQLRTADGIPVENAPRRWLGDNAWLLIALNNYHHLAKNNKYEALSSVLSSWIISLQDDDGGLWGGYNANGSRISKIAEGNIDAFNAIAGYTEFHKRLLEYLKNVRWDSNLKELIAWADNPAYRYALDLYSWSYCIFEDFPIEVISNAKKFETRQKSTVARKTIHGYCFDEDRDVIWLEGTGQMIVALQKARNTDRALLFLNEMKKNFVQSSLFPGTYGLPYTTNSGTSYADDKLWEGADTNPAVSSTVWYLFASLSFDPLAIGYQKNIPSEDKFWLK